MKQTWNFNLFKSSQTPKSITSNLSSPLHIQEAGHWVRDRWNRVSFLIYEAGCAPQSLLLSRSDKWRVYLNFLLLMKEFIRCYLTHSTTGGPSSSCEMIILRNNSHGGIIRVCMGIFTTALRYKIIRQILKKNTSPYFHSVSLVIWPLTLMKRTHISELSISRFSTFIRKGLWIRHTNNYLAVQ